jgi:GTPase SAR1 family protein
MSDQDDFPPGLRLRHLLRGHSAVIGRLSWSPNGQVLASSSDDRTIRLWDARTGEHLHTLTGHSSLVYSVAWSPNGQMLASSSDDRTIRLWDARTGEHLHTLTGHSEMVRSVAWSPDGQMLVSGSGDKTTRLWDARTGEHFRTFTDLSDTIFSVIWSPDGKYIASGCADATVQVWNVKDGTTFLTFREHASGVYCVAWSPDGRVLAASSADKTIRLWSVQTNQQVYVLEGHTSTVTSISFSSDGHLLASKSHDGTVRIWHVDTLETVAILEEPSSGFRSPGLAFQPNALILATLGENDRVIRIWHIDVPTLLRTASATSSAHYTNAKVVLVGDSGVGKSGLGLVLTGQPFVPTESTHGRNVWTFDSYQAELDNKRKENRETWLWDLAGQPGYRLIHQLHLNDVAVALLVFDSRSETDPFAGVDHWVRALRMAQWVQGDSAIPMKKFLVAARTDRSGKSVSRERIDALLQAWRIDGYFETSAKEGQNIADLEEAIKNAIDWNTLPKVTSTELFQRIKAFLVTEKEARRLLSTSQDLYRVLLISEKDLIDSENLYAQFETCIGRIESQGLIQRLSFGNLVLLQPELLDAYASALVNAVRDEPDGLGSILEEKVRTCDFAMPGDERIAVREQEKLLLIAMVEDMLRYEIALREQGDDGAYLVFPSQSTRTNPDLPNPEGKSVIFRFEGPIQNIYATLAVRLSHSGLFVKKNLWKNAATYTTKMGGIYGLFLDNIAEGRAELTLFFEQGAREEIGFHFEEYVAVHLQRRALPGTIQRRRIFVCPGCNTPLDDLAVTRRRERGIDWMTCGVCDAKVSLLDREERLAATPVSLVSEMDRLADTQRDRSANASVLQGKIATEDFDVFLCHNGEDKAAVKKIGEQLKERGILPWLDDWELRPGLPWQPLLEQQIKQIKSAAVFVGKNGRGPWQDMELYAFLRKFTKREEKGPVIPVILADCTNEPELPAFLEGMTWVDFRKQDPDPMKQLIWGITGQRDYFI